LTIVAFRLSKTIRLSSAFTGDGARTYGGRWNSPGTKVVYASSTLSLATLEIMVHLESYKTLCEDYSFVNVEMPSEIIETVDPTTLRPGWDSGAPGPESQQIGDSWASKLESAVLSVPTVLVPGEVNYLLNPDHPDFRRIAISKPKRICFDRRLVK
jgi:RES domain-containing protein